jgi:hypothetical protein
MIPLVAAVPALEIGGAARLGGTGNNQARHAKLTADALHKRNTFLMISLLAGDP